MDFRPVIEAIVREVSTGQPRAAMAAKFHNTLAHATVEICRRIALESALRRVCLRGGTFQNVRLLGSTAETDLQLGYVTTLNGTLTLQANAAYQMNYQGQTGANSLAVLSRAKIKF